MSYIALFGTYTFASLKVLPSANRIIQTFNSINFNFAAGRLVISLLKENLYHLIKLAFSEINIEDKGS